MGITRIHGAMLCIFTYTGHGNDCHQNCKACSLLHEEVPELARKALTTRCPPRRQPDRIALEFGLTSATVIEG